jgi:hypothetical protein
MELSAALRGVAFLIGGICFLLYECFTLALIIIAPMILMIIVARIVGKRLKHDREA